MTDNKKAQDNAALDAHWDTLTIFEQILEHAPNDVDALHEVFRASVSLDEKRRANTYGARLGRLAVDSHDQTRMQTTLDLLAPHTAMGQDIDAAVTELFHTLAAIDPSRAESGAAKPPEAGAAGAGQAAQPESADVDANEIIAIVSRILEEMPDDRESLEMLATAYLKAGDGAKAAQTLARLAEVLMRDHDRDEAAAVYKKLEMLQALAPDTAATVAKLQKFLSGEVTEEAPQAEAAEAAPPESPSLDIDPSRRRAVLSDEMDLLWELRQLKLITEEQYAGVVSDLTSIISNDAITTISAIHGLATRSLPNLDTLLVQLSTKTATPIIALANFDLQSASLQKLPLQYIIFQGVIPFDKMGQEHLVATLNPFSQRLRQETKAAMGGNCHFFLVTPADFDTAIELVKNRCKSET